MQQRLTTGVFFAVLVTVGVFSRPGYSQPESASKPTLGKPKAPVSPASPRKPMARERTMRGMSREKLPRPDSDPTLSPRDLRYPRKFNHRALRKLTNAKLLSVVPWLLQNRTRYARDNALLFPSLQPIENDADADSALVQLKRAVARYTELGSYPLIAASFHTIAWIYWIKGDLDNTVKYLRETEGVLETHMQSSLAGLTELERRRFMAMFYGDVDMSVALAIQTDDNAAKRLAFTKLLHHKGRIVDSMASDFAALRRHPDPEVQTLLSAYRDAQSRYSSALLRGPKDPQLSKQYLRNLEPLRARVQVLEKQMARHGHTLRRADTSVDIEAIQAAMSPDSVLVEWIRYQPDLSGSRMFYAASVLFKHGEPVWIDLGDSIVIDKTVAAFHEALSHKRQGTFVLARTLDKLIMEPVREHIGDGCHDIWLSPDSALLLIPFAALVDREGRYLVERHSFTYLTSGRDLLRMQKTSAPRSPPVVVADPAYGLGPDGSRRFTRLPNAGAEARMVKTRLPRTRVLKGLQASERNVMSVHGPRIFHVASHAYVEPHSCAGSSKPGADTHLLPGLALADANTCQGGDNDGLLTAAEITAMDLQGTKLAVLSACETGSGALGIQDDAGQLTGLGEGVYGLRRALVLAGAETQVTSLWPVDDLATYELMTGYYGELIRGSGRSEALRETQRALLRRTPGLHPYYWSGFIVSGDPRPLDGKAVRSPATCEPPQSAWNFHVGAHMLAGLGNQTELIGSRITLAAELALPRGMGIYGSADVGLYGDEFMFRPEDPARSATGLGRLEFGGSYTYEPFVLRGGFDIHAGQLRFYGRGDILRGPVVKLRATLGSDLMLSDQARIRAWGRLSAGLGLAGIMLLGAGAGVHERPGYGYLPAIDFSITHRMGGLRAYLAAVVPLAQESPYGPGVVFGVLYGSEQINPSLPLPVSPDDG